MSQVDALRRVGFASVTVLRNMMIYDLRSMRVYVLPNMKAYALQGMMVHQLTDDVRLAGEGLAEGM